MPDTNHDQFDTGRSIAEKLQAEILETNPETFFVKYGDNDADIEPRTPLNEVLFESSDEAKRDLYELLVYGKPLRYTWTEDTGEDHETAIDDAVNRLSNFISSKNRWERHTIAIHAEDGGAYLEIEEDEERTPVPPEYREDVLLNIAADTDDVGDAARSLRQIRHAIEDEYADRTVVGAFLNRFPEDRIREARNGWIVDESYLIMYDGTNHVVDTTGQQFTSSRDTEFIDDLSFDIEEEVVAEAPSGGTCTLGENEQQFLATVETFLHPEDYLGYDLSGRIVSGRQSERELTDEISHLASTADDKSFRDPTIDSKSHGHSLEKHTLTASFNVTQDAIDRLHFAQNTHGAVNEIARRESEFRRVDFDVFRDTHNDDDARWREIKSRARGAPIKDEVQRRMDSMFGSV